METLEAAKQRDRVCCRAWDEVGGVSGNKQGMAARVQLGSDGGLA